MAYRDAYDDTSRKAVIFVILLVVAAVVVIAGLVTWSVVRNNYLKSPAGVEEALLKEEEGGELFRTIKRTYPQEFAKLRDRMSERMRAGAKIPELRAETAAMVRAAGQAHRAELSQAPHRQLEIFHRAERAMIEALQTSDVRMCGRYVATGFEVGAQAPRKVRPLLLAMTIAQWKAAAAGRDHPAGRKIGAEVELADSIALVKAMRDEGMTEDDIQTFSTSSRLLAAEPAQQCGIGVAMLRAFDALPANQTDRLLAWILAQKQ